MIWFGILDLLAGPVFLFFFLYKLRGVDYAAFGLQSGKHTDTETAHSHNGHEKPANGVAGNTPAPAANGSPPAAGGSSVSMPVPVTNPV
uniref:SH3 domain-containing protein n=1 Tax=Ganoderma boninense TaxID=34458 RepID=A0A5K1K7Y9_9APHY|nr:SH3 domain-containing protein [Ganoderma boninense]